MSATEHGLRISKISAGSGPMGTGTDKAANAAGAAAERKTEKTQRTQKRTTVTSSAKAPASTSTSTSTEAGAPSRNKTRKQKGAKRRLDALCKEPKCRRCGCTQNSACEDGRLMDSCCWAETDLCSACLSKVEFNRWMAGKKPTTGGKRREKEPLTIDDLAAIGMVIKGNLERRLDGDKGNVRDAVERILTSH